jgi:hypothetical protein
MSNLDFVMDSDCEDNFATLDLFLSKSPEDDKPVTEEILRSELAKVAKFRKVVSLDLDDHSGAEGRRHQQNFLGFERLHSVRLSEGATGWWGPRRDQDLDQSLLFKRGQRTRDSSDRHQE